MSRQDLPPVTVDPETARDVADRVLSGRAYVEAARPPSLRERFFDWLGRIFSEIFAALSSSGGRGIVAWVIIGIFLAAIAYLLWRFTQNRVQLEKVRPVKDELSIDITENLTAEQWLDLATEAERASDWRTALRCRHRALVTELIDARVITARPGQTAGEIGTEIGARVPTAAAEMQEATNLFKDTWYGWTAAGPDERDRFALLADRVIAASTSTAAPVAVEA